MKTLFQNADAYFHLLHFLNIKIWVYKFRTSSVVLKPITCFIGTTEISCQRGSNIIVGSVQEGYEGEITLKERKIQLNQHFILVWMLL